MLDKDVMHESGTIDIHFIVMKLNFFATSKEFRFLSHPEDAFIVEPGWWLSIMHNDSNYPEMLIKKVDIRKMCHT